MKAWKMGIALMLTAVFSAACEGNSTTNGNANNANQTAIKNEPAAAAANANAANTNANPMGALAAPGEGAALYEARNCHVCHGADGKGNAQMKNIPNFTDAAWQRKTTDAEMINVIRNGKPPMPAYTKQLTDEQVKSVIAYIRALAK
ncbi:MAG: c-type cytochrome [Blastocatellia bacterium]